MSATTKSVEPRRDFSLVQNMELPRRNVGVVDPEEGHSPLDLMVRIHNWLSKSPHEERRTWLNRAEMKTLGESLQKFHGITAGGRVAYFESYDDADIWSDMLYWFRTLLQDWCAKDHALRLALGFYLGFENIPQSKQADYWLKFSQEDVPGLLCFALGHNPMSDEEGVQDVLRRVFVWGQDEDPDQEYDEEGEPIKKERPCPHTLSLFGVDTAEPGGDKTVVTVLPASPDAALLAYAELEERSARLAALEQEAYEAKGDAGSWSLYREAIWKLRDEIMPEFASQCPITTTDEELREWYGWEWEEYTHTDLRDYRYGNESDSENSFGSLLHARLTELRTTALAKARGEVQNV